MLKVVKMLKDNQYGSGDNTMEQTKDGKFNILMRKNQLQRKELIRNSVSI
jgi:GH43 family beta-xylosidase